MKIFSFATLPSTNTYAVNNFDNFENQDIIMAESQTAGKGRKGRKWSSETGGLYFTIILKPTEIKTENLSSLTQIMAIAVCKTVKNLGAKVYLKWPNDVLYKGKKFCGILSEAVLKNNKCVGLIIGVGININQEKIISDKPFTSLAEMKIKISKTVLLEEIFKNFKSAQNKNFIEDFKKLCPNFGKEIIVENKKGIFEDIDAAGRMILKTENGREIIMAGDVQF